VKVSGGSTKRNLSVRFAILLMVGLHRLELWTMEKKHPNVPPLPRARAHRTCLRELECGVRRGRFAAARRGCDRSDRAGCVRMGRAGLGGGCKLLRPRLAVPDIVRGWLINWVPVLAAVFDRGAFTEKCLLEGVVLCETGARARLKRRPPPELAAPDAGRHALPPRHES
jgi:hypothetical protein